MNPGLFFLYLASILVSAVLAFMYRKYLGSRKLLIMIPYLFLVLLQETVLGIASLLDYYTSNALVYNIYRPLSAMVFAFIYFNIPMVRPFRKLILWTIIIYGAITLISYCFFESIFLNSSYLTLARGLVITFFAILFLFSYFHLDNVSEEKYWRPILWITIGVATFYPVISLSLSFQKFISANGATFYGFKLYQIIPQVVSIFMYGCFSYAFYLCQKKN